MASTQAKPELKKVGECLYRNAHGTYFALVKRQGKQFKRSLHTQDEKLARRRLAAFRERSASLVGTAQSLLFEDLVTQWLASVRSHLKASSYTAVRVRRFS